MRFPSFSRTSECLPRFITDSNERQCDQQQTEPKKFNLNKDVTSFIAQAVNRGSGLHLLRSSSSIFDKLLRREPFDMSTSSEDSVKSIKKTVQEESLPFVIVLPDLTLLASRELNDEQDVVLLAKNEVYWDHSEITEYWLFISWHSSGYGDGSSLTFAEIEDSFLSKLIVVGKDVSPTKEGEMTLVENMARLYFSVYEGTGSEKEAEENAKSVMKQKGFDPGDFMKGDGASWKDETVEELCKKVYKLVNEKNKHNQLIKFFIFKHFFPKDEYQGNITPSIPEDSLSIFTYHKTGGVWSLFGGTPKIQGFFGRKQFALDSTETEIATEKKNTSGSHQSFFEKVEEIMLQMFEHQQDAVLRMYKSKSELNSERQVNGHLQKWISKEWAADIGKISKSLSDASKRAVKAVLEANGFKSPTVDDIDPQRSPAQNTDEPRSADNIGEISEANNGVQTSGTNNVGPSAERNNNAQRGQPEAEVAYWVMTAVTTDVQYQQAVQFLTQKKDKCDEKCLADFVCNSRNVSGIPTYLNYEHEVESRDPHNGCCSRLRKLVGKFIRPIAILAESVLDERSKKYWCARNAVMTWSIFGLVLYLLFAGLVAVSVMIAVRSRDNSWEAAEVAMNLILTGAVAILLGTIGFEHGGRQVVLDALMLARAVEDLPQNPVHQRSLLKELVGKKYPESYVKSSGSDICTWLPRTGTGWTKLPQLVRFKDIAADGKLFLSNRDMSAKICGERRKIAIGDENVLTVAPKPMSRKQKEFADSHGTHVTVSNMVK